MSDVVDGPARLDTAAVDRIFQEASGRAVATLIRVFGDIDTAEDAVQGAFAVALRKWPADGLPPNPGGWITTTARNLARDRLRRESRGRQLAREVGALSSITPDAGMPEEEVGAVKDDRLRLIFTCCNPALSTEAQVALTLRLLGGLSTDEVARAFLVPEPTMAQRLLRAKPKIKAARIPYRMPADHELAGPLAPSAGRRLPRLQRWSHQPVRARTRTWTRKKSRRARGPTAPSCCSASRTAPAGIRP